jgi:hypothetical protein
VPSPKCRSRLAGPARLNLLWGVAVALGAMTMFFPGGAAGRVASAPPNDDIANAEVVLGANPDSTSGTIIEATSETSFETLWGSSPAVWYRFTPAEDARLRWQITRTSGDAGFHPEADLYRATSNPPADGNALEWADGLGNGTASPPARSVILAAGETYYISVEDWEFDSDVGGFDLSFHLIPSRLYERWEQSQIDDDIWDVSTVSGLQGANTGPWAISSTASYDGTKSVRHEPNGTEKALIYDDRVAGGQSDIDYWIAYRFMVPSWSSVWANASHELFLPAFLTSSGQSGPASGDYLYNYLEADNTSSGHIWLNGQIDPVAISAGAWHEFRISIRQKSSNGRWSVNEILDGVQYSNNLEYWYSQTSMPKPRGIWWISRSYNTGGVLHIDPLIWSPGQDPGPIGSATQCANGTDDDGDSKIDLADPGCADAEDDSEAPDPQAQCANGVDDDGDGKVDLADPGCTNAQDDSESPDPQCANGTDDDSDGRIDLADPGCASAQDDSESPDPEQILAASFRPHLRFDAGEHWRPISIHAFLAEKVGATPAHTACFRDSSDTNYNCTPVGTTADLLAFEAIPHGNDHVVLDVEGNETAGGEGESYHAPSLVGCAVPADRDCDSGPNSVIYYNRTVKEVPTEGPGAKSYWDYWYFFRYNHSAYSTGCSTGILDLCFEHEGDWEGVTVVTAVEPDPTIYWVSFAGHNYDARRYAADALREANRLQGSHVGVYVAAGTHAAYSFPCNGIPAPCRQDDGGVGLPDGQHGGEDPWSRNVDSECAVVCVQPLPEVSTVATDGPQAAGWANWSGWWGNPCSSVGCGRVHGPDSPGLHQRYLTPWVVKDSTVPAFRIGGTPKATPRQTDVDCSSWFGPDVAALACDKASLQRTIAHNRFHQPGALQVTVRNTQKGSSWPGLAQVLGNPLRRGDTLDLAGQARGQTPLLLRVQLVGSETAVARFEVRDIARGTRFALSTTGPASAPEVWLTAPDGRSVLARSVTLPPRAPTALTATRKRGVVTVSFVAGGSRTAVWITDKAGRKIERVISNRPNTRQTFTVRAPGRSVTILAATLSASQAYTLPVTISIK